MITASSKWWCMSPVCARSSSYRRVLKKMITHLHKETVFIRALPDISVTRNKSRKYALPPAVLFELSKTFIYHAFVRSKFAEDKSPESRRNLQIHRGENKERNEHLKQNLENGLGRSIPLWKKAS